jgi:hypothetical protein
VLIGSGAASTAVCVPTSADKKRVSRSVVTVAAGGSPDDRPGFGNAAVTAGLHVEVTGVNDGTSAGIVTLGADCTGIGVAVTVEPGGDAAAVEDAAERGVGVD